MTQDANALSTAPPAAGVDATPRAWGFWATLGWAVLAFGLGAGIITAAVVWFHWGRLDNVLEVQDDPWFPLQLIAINAVQIVVVAAAARAAGWPVGQYLGLDRPSRRHVLHGIAAVIVMLLVLELLTYLLGRAHVTPFQTDAYRAASQAGTLPLLWLAFVMAAPLGEEIVFRGFVFRGWAASPLGAHGTIVVTSLVFAASHPVRLVRDVSDLLHGRAVRMAALAQRLDDSHHRAAHGDQPRLDPVDGREGRRALVYAGCGASRVTAIHGALEGRPCALTSAAMAGLRRRRITCADRSASCRAGRGCPPAPWRRRECAPRCAAVRRSAGRPASPSAVKPHGSDSAGQHTMVIA